MKTTKSIILIIFIHLLLISSLQSQSWYEWGDPYPMTDSLSDNANPVLFLSYDYNNNEQILFMFWEKSFDTLSTEIWMDNLLDDDPPISVLSESGVHFKHPKVLDAQYWPYPDTLFYLFFETNQNGNTDIYYKMYQGEGVFSEPKPFATGSADDTQLSLGREFIFWDPLVKLNVATWINEGKLFSRFLARQDSQYFTEPVIIDSTQCSNPIASGGGIGESVLYLRSDSLGNFLYQSIADNGGTWSEPEVYYDSTSCANPTRTHWYYDPCWSTYIDTSWRIMIETWDGYEVYDISSPEPFDPAVMGLVMGVKSYFPEVWVATTYEDEGYDEIFMLDAWGGGDFFNFSNSGTMNRNPNYFHGEYDPSNYYCWFDYLVWESYRNGHWQLWASRVIQCGGNIEEETGKANPFISIYPNPIVHETTLEFTLDTRSDLTIDIFDNRGMQITRIADGSFDPGTHQLRWNADGLAAGMYVIKMRVGDLTYTSKVIKNQ